MSRYTEAFEILAERGSVDGADVLIESLVEIEPIEASPVVEVRDRRYRPFIGIAAAISVVIAGIWLWGGSQGGEVAERAAITWISVEAQDVQYGPGGFVATPLRSSGVLYSSDGTDWEPVELLPAGEGLHVEHLTHSNSRWVLVGSDDANVFYSWVSDDGHTWKAVDLPVDLWSAEAPVFGRGQFLIHNRPQEPGDVNEFWQSEDGLIWERLDPEGLPRDVGYVLGGGPSGYVAVPTGAYRPRSDVYFSTDGVHWTEGTLELPADWIDWWFGRIESVGERWLMFGSRFTLDDHSLPVLGSGDGLKWALMDSPIHPQGEEVHIGALASGPGGLYEAPVTSRQGDDVTQRVWLTKDGLSWEQVGVLPEVATAIAIADGFGVYTTGGDEVTVETSAATIFEPEKSVTFEIDLDDRFGRPLDPDVVSAIMTAIGVCLAADGGTIGLLPVSGSVVSFTVPDVTSERAARSLVESSGCLAASLPPVSSVIDASDLLP